MIKVYFKQAWEMMKQHKLFTSIYVVGTGLSIALIMTLFIIFYVKFTPIYPEYNRDRILVIKSVKRVAKKNSFNWSLNHGTTYYMVNELLKDLPHLEACAAVFSGTSWADDGDMITLPDQRNLLVKAKYVNGDFWRVFTFQFLEGVPFTVEETEAKEQLAVISQSLSQKLFATTSSVGEKVLFNGQAFRVCGVVKDVSNATPESAAEIWVPITNNVGVMESYTRDDVSGEVHAFLLAPTSADKKKLREEVLDVINKYNQQNQVYEHEFFGQPDEYWFSTFRTGMDVTLTVWGVLKQYIYMLLAFLIIPALNLSGMISSRMEDRLSELGVRKAYGANNGQLIIQVLWENLLLTGLGGVLGLLFSYLIVFTASNWILTLFDDFIWTPGERVDLTFEMLFNPMIFIASLLFCVLLNLVSSLIPTVWALRNPIIQSIHTKR